MQPSSVLRGLQRSLTDSPEIRRPVVDRPVGVPRKTVELMTARDQTEENDDARVRPVLTSPRRPSTVMLEEQAAQGTLTLTTVAAVAERRAFEEARTVPHAGVVMTSPRRPSTEMLDEQAAQGTLTLTTVAAVAERRTVEEARTNPPEGCSSGSEEETRASPTVSTHRGDSSFEAKSSAPLWSMERGAMMTQHLNSVRRRRTETASVMSHTRWTWTSSLMP